MYLSGVGKIFNTWSESAVNSNVCMRKINNTGNHIESYYVSHSVDNIGVPKKYSILLVELLFLLITFSDLLSTFSISAMPSLPVLIQ